MSDFDVKVVALEGVIRNVYAADPIAVAAMKKVTRESSKRAYDIAYSLVPVDKGDMQELLDVFLSPDELQYELGWEDAKFEARGVRPHAAYQEYGDGVNYKATPSITPAYHQEAPRYQREIGNEVRAALERRKISE